MIVNWDIILVEICMLSVIYNNQLHLYHIQKLLIINIERRNLFLAFASHNNVFIKGARVD